MLLFERLMSANSVSKRRAGLLAALPILLVSGSASALQPLATFVASSRAGNFDRREAVATAEQRGAEADQAKSRLAPTLTAKASYTRNERETSITTGSAANPITLTITPLDQLDASFTLNVPLVDVGAWMRVGATGATADAARMRASASSDDAEKSVTRAYYQVVASEATKVAAAQALATAEESRTITQRRVEAGSASDLEMERARAEVARARQVVASATQACAVARRSLATLSGLAPSEGSVPLPDDDLAPAPPAAQLEPGTDRLPSIQAAALDVRAASKSEDAAWGALLPTLSASASERLTNATGFAGHVSSWSIAATASWTIDPSAYFAAKAQAASHAVAAVRAERTRAAAKDDLWNAAEEVRAQIAKVEAARAEALATARAAKLAKDRLDAGAARQLDVIQADRDAFSSEVARIQAAGDLAYARALLLLVSGQRSATTSTKEDGQ
jgi:outer membrane protein TolC